MANGKLLRSLIKSGLQGDQQGFRAASEAVIAEEREKKHHLLANDLEKLLYGTSSDSAVLPSHLKLISNTPTSKDSGLALLEVRSVVRDDEVFQCDLMPRHQRLELSFLHQFRNGNIQCFS